MNDCGQRIADLRKRHNLTQLELGNKLNVTAQAVSKWETGLSEPDIETLKKISIIFNVSIDELLSNEVAATERQTEQPEKPEKPKAEEPKKVIVAKCERCGKDVAAGEYSIALTHHSERFGRSNHNYTTQHIFCNDCYRKYQEEERRKKIQQEKENAYSNKDEIDTGFRRGTIWGTLAAIAAVIAVLITGKYVPFSPVLTAILSITAAYGFFAMVFQCFFDGYVLEIFEFFTRSFNLPGFIFSLDIESVALMIATKISLSIIFGLLSAAIFLVGVVVAATCSLFTFPFSLKKNFERRKFANAEAERVSKLK